MPSDVDCNDKRASKDSSSRSTSFLMLKAVAGYCESVFVKLMTTFSRVDSLIDPENAEMT